MFNITPLVRTLIIINVGVFLMQNLLSNLHITEYMSLWDFDSGLFRPYQFFTYMFAHGGFGHIFFNMLAFASFARSVVDSEASSDCAPKAGALVLAAGAGLTAELPIASNAIYPP